MAGLHNAIKYGGQLLKGLAFAVGVDPQESGVERLGETLTPTIDPWTMPEWAYLRAERLIASAFDIVGAAGTVPEVMLYNPQTSRRLLVVTNLHWSWVTTTGATFQYRFFRGALPVSFTVQASGPVDTRDPGLIANNGGSTGQLATAANAVVQGGNVFDTMQGEAAPVRPINDVNPVILAPGTGFSFGPGVVGVQRFIGGIRWRERIMFPNEQARA